MAKNHQRLSDIARRDSFLRKIDQIRRKARHNASRQRPGN
jgi:hypothetical protein